MLHSEIISVRSEIRRQHTNALRGLNVEEYSTAKSGGT
jgi:hypothetical protein